MSGGTVTAFGKTVVGRPCRAATRAASSSEASDSQPNSPPNVSRIRPYARGLFVATVGGQPVLVVVVEIDRRRRGAEQLGDRDRERSEIDADRVHVGCPGAGCGDDGPGERRARVATGRGNGALRWKRSRQSGSAISRVAPARTSAASGRTTVTDALWRSAQVVSAEPPAAGHDDDVHGAEGAQCAELQACPHRQPVAGLGGHDRSQQEHPAGLETATCTRLVTHRTPVGTLDLLSKGPLGRVPCRNVPIEGEQQGLDRRALVKRMAIGAFAVPAIVSFQLDSLARAGTFTKKPPKHTYPNQTEPNQHFPNQDCPPKPPKPPKPPHGKPHEKPPPKPKPPKPSKPSKPSKPVAHEHAFEAGASRRSPPSRRSRPSTGSRRSRSAARRSRVTAVRPPRGSRPSGPHARPAGRGADRQERGAVLDACLASIRDVVDEIVVVDTGSTDESVAIARRHGAIVHEHAWTGDFAGGPQRRRSTRTDCDWILYIDADERLDPVERERGRGAARRRAARSRSGSCCEPDSRLDALPGVPDLAARPAHPLRGRDPREGRAGDPARVRARTIGRSASPTSCSRTSATRATRRTSTAATSRSCGAQLEVEPDNLFNLHHLARVLEGLGEGAEAEHVLERAVEVSRTRPGDPLGSLAIADLLRLRHLRGDEVGELLGEAREPVPGQPADRFHRGALPDRPRALRGGARELPRAPRGRPVGTLPDKGPAYDFAHLRLALVRRLRRLPVQARPLHRGRASVGRGGGRRAGRSVVCREAAARREPGRAIAVTAVSRRR